MKRKDRNVRKGLLGFIIYEAAIITLAIFITRRFCIIGLSTLGLYTVLFNALLAFCGIVVFFAGWGRIKKFFSKKTNWAVLLLLIPIFISFTKISGTITKKFLFWTWNETFLTTITPSLMSTLFAIILLLAVILRNNPKRMFSKPSRFILLAEDVLFISSFLNILCTNEPLPIPGINLSCQSLLVIAAVFSWVGIKEVAGIIWAAVLILGVTRLCSIDNVMGFTGSLYLLCAFISGVLQWVELNVHVSFDGLKQQFSALNDDAASVFLKDRKNGALPDRKEDGCLPTVQHNSEPVFEDPVSDED